MSNFPIQWTAQSARARLLAATINGPLPNVSGLCIVELGKSDFHTLQLERRRQSSSAKTIRCKFDVNFIIEKLVN